MASLNLVRTGKNIRAEMTILSKITPNPTRGGSRYKKITKLLREDIVEYTLSHPNVNPSCVSSDIVTVLNPESNQKKFFPKLLLDIYVRDIHSYMIKPFKNGGLASAANFV